MKSDAPATRTVSWEADDGIRLVAHIHGEPRAGLPPVLCLPGLTRNARDFSALAAHLANHPTGSREVIACDLRGRGASDPAPPETYTPIQEAEDTLAGLAAMGIDTVSLVGTSRGGIVGMLMAAIRPAVFDRVVLNDIGPFIEVGGLARIEGAMRAGATPAQDWPAMAKRVAKSQERIFPRFDRDDWERFARQLCREDAAGIVFDYDPALHHVFDDFDPATFRGDIWDVYAAIRTVPTLAVRGGLSDLLTQATVETMRRCHAVFESLVVPDQGHAPVLWERSVLEPIAAFLCGDIVQPV